MQWHHSANSRAQSQSQGGQENTQWAMALLAPMARGPKSLLTAPLTLTAHAHSVSHLTAGSTPYIRDTQCPQCAFSLVVGFMSFAHLEVAPSFCSDPSGPFLGFRIDTRSSVQSTHTRYARDTQTPRDTYHYSIQKWSILPLSSWNSALSLVNSFLIFFFSSTVIPLCWSRLESSCTSAMQAGSFTRPGIERDGWLVLTR